MERETEKRARDLSERAASYGIYTETHFLTEGEQTALSRLPLPLKPRFVGGFEEAERRLAVFGEEDQLGYPYEAPILLLEIRPKMQKYADSLTHRDLLGALMNLGICRDTLGDLILHENVGYQFVLDSIAPFIEENLHRVRHTDVTVKVVPALPEGAGVCLEEKVLVCASLRLDAVVGAVFDLSRSDAKALVENERVTIFGRTECSASYLVKEGERVSVRGHGRFYFDEESGSTRSGKSRIRVRVYR